MLILRLGVRCSRKVTFGFFASKTLLLSLPHVIVMRLRGSDLSYDVILFQEKADFVFQLAVTGLVGRIRFHG